MEETAKDIIFDEDLVILNGDFAVEESDGQHIEHIMLADKGQFRQWPLIGVGLARGKNSSIRPQALRQEIKLQLRSDNFRVVSINIDEGDELRVSIEAKRLR